MSTHKTIATVCLWLAAAAPAIAQETTERWNFPLDGREWKLVQPGADARPGERVYVRPGENAYFWSERIASGHQAGGSGPDDYIVGFVEDLIENCRPLKVSPVVQEPTSVIFQWEGDCRIVGPQFEYRRVVAATDGIHYLAYSAKPNRLTPGKQASWLAIIRAAQIKSPAEPAR